VPLVSVVLPTFDRADVIGRAVRSALAQWHQDLELLVVDDGSRDGTVERLRGMDPRLRVLRQENAGVAAARNHGIREAKGSLIAFLDSDDEWPEHHLALAVAFFGAHPGEHLYSSEWWQVFGPGRIIRHFRPSAGEWYPALARRVGSTLYRDAPEGGDPYLNVYPERLEVGAWGRDLVDRSGYQGVFHYRGDIFPHWRFGYLMGMQSTVITRRAADEVGPAEERHRAGSDYGHLARLCRSFRANYFSLPGCFKHERGLDGRALAEDHLATGRSSLRYDRSVREQFEELFWRPSPGDAELGRIRGLLHLNLARSAIADGELDEGRRALAIAREVLPPSETRVLTWIARLAPGAAAARLAQRGLARGSALGRRLLRALLPARAG
jgi:glycosyltransferase involved in cell wall biosynthesis